MAEIVPTGIPRLDEALIEGKGVARGSSIVVEGTSGAGKELLAKQFAASGIGTENVVYFSTDETSSELVETFEHYNWPTDMRIVNIGTQYFEKVLARELHASRFKQEGLSVSELLWKNSPKLPKAGSLEPCCSTKARKDLYTTGELCDSTCRPI